MPSTVDTVIVGAGQSGLAVSALLSARGRDHVVLDRGGAAHRWREERWDSLRLLTPNWLTRLPGWSYDGPDLDGYMTARDVAAWLQRYAASSRRRSSRRKWKRSLPAGGVLVVVASATGVQLADEMLQDGRRVVIAVGSHSRLPRTYRGMDIFWWLDRLGALFRTIGDRAPGRSRREPSLQLIGVARSAVDLLALRRRGARLVGRMRRIDGDVAYFDDHLPERTAAADAVMTRILDAADAHVAADPLLLDLRELTVQSDQSRPDGFIAEPGPAQLSLGRHGITSVLFATGLRPDYDWLRVPVVDAHGYIEQWRGTTRAPGLHVVGQPFQHRRDSTYIDGARWNAQDVVASLTRQGATAMPRRQRSASCS
ncbi:pyridine nucleotide-disulfide oxidoreductase [Microbacterium sp. CPCC 204701]|uniref:pyridine nucleotide-disulfide oxidoreductase n=1 Tax=Microbacterium sp. CPCC 204701 TaxID=2493084 RepID=UPI000FDAB085|nr:pyridine nucleotide-disulfide oxidoreductase [Microbacterium sp. CPCC 204701]